MTHSSDMEESHLTTLGAVAVRVLQEIDGSFKGLNTMLNEWTAYRRCWQLREPTCMGKQLGTCRARSHHHP